MEEEDHPNTITECDRPVLFLHRGSPPFRSNGEPANLRLAALEIVGAGEVKDKLEDITMLSHLGAVLK